jgi:hypothetical protein
MTNDQIDEIAKDALAWAEGSWGQGRNDPARYDKDTMTLIYSRLADLANEKAKRFAQ